MDSTERSGAFRPASVVFAVALAVVSAVRPAQGQAEFSDWSLPANLGSPINTGGTEVGPHISKDGLSLYHLRNFDAFVSQRATVDDAWGPRQSLGTNINSTLNEASPSLDDVSFAPESHEDVSYAHGPILPDLSLAGHARAVAFLDCQSGEARRLCGDATKPCRASGEMDAFSEVLSSVRFTPGSRRACYP